MNSQEPHSDDFVENTDRVVSRDRPLSLGVPRREVSRPIHRPKVALMGEFSAGKSTLSNILLGASALPVNVTATQLPPVWISQGSDAPYSVSTDGEEHPIDFGDLESVTVSGTSHIRIFNNAARLTDFDLIDMPGISDPNMAAEVWQSMIHHADIVIWCSHATQAWRQSEAAVWATLPKELHERSILLLTRMDKILTDRDKSRVIKRVESETKGLFRKVMPASLIKALSADEQSEAWQESGAAELTGELDALVTEVLSGERRSPDQTPEGTKPMGAVKPPQERSARMVMPTRVRPRPLGS